MRLVEVMACEAVPIRKNDMATEREGGETQRGIQCNVRYSKINAIPMFIHSYSHLHVPGIPQNFWSCGMSTLQPRSACTLHVLRRAVKFMKSTTHCSYFSTQSSLKLAAVV
ncbi:hypothetical protein PM082_009770 [Marasmius tenuissimus]|nr:hypothetical protein PM082_009770 [Marasmius tenuissimus]